MTYNEESALASVDGLPEPLVSLCEVSTAEAVDLPSDQPDHLLHQTAIQADPVSRSVSCTLQTLPVENGTKLPDPETSEEPFPAQEKVTASRTAEATTLDTTDVSQPDHPSACHPVVEAGTPTTEPLGRGVPQVKTLSQALVASGPSIALGVNVMEIEIKEISDDQPSAFGPEAKRPFRIYGWDEHHKNIWVRNNATQQLFEMHPTTNLVSILRLHSDVHYWIGKFPNKNDGINCNHAMTAIIKEADKMGVFSPGDLRGRGMYLDEGRVVFNRGDVLMVDGQVTAFSDLETRYAYIRREPLQIDLNTPELTDEEGLEVLNAVTAMGWVEPEHPLYAGGFVVTSLAGGAIPFRPVLQNSASFGSGKSEFNNNVVIPLQAGIGIKMSNPTEAGLRQQLNNDVLPIWIDESENEDPFKRQQHLQFARYCYDGSSTCRGGQSGKAITYQLRSSLSISGINATIPNPADRSRIVCIRRQHQPADVWAAVNGRCKQVITRQTGERLLRRVLNNVPTLCANIEVFKAAIQSRIPDGVPTRYCDTYGTTLAGAHLLLSTRRLSVEEAGQWLQDQGWSYRPDPDAGENPALQESEDCLEHLLSFSPSGYGSTMRVLLEHLKTTEERDACRVTQLGQFGLKVDAAGLIVANQGKITDIFRGTKWSQSAHKDRLKELPGAVLQENTVRFKGGGSHRCVLIPWSVLDLDSDLIDPEEE
jgi:putative DNA primase/helicase